MTAVAPLEVAVASEFASAAAPLAVVPVPVAVVAPPPSSSSAAVVSGPRVSIPATAPGAVRILPSAGPAACLRLRFPG